MIVKFTASRDYFGEKETNASETFCYLIETESVMVLRRTREMIDRRDFSGKVVFKKRSSI